LTGISWQAVHQINFQRNVFILKENNSSQSIVILSSYPTRTLMNQAFIIFFGDRLLTNKGKGPRKTLG